MRGGEDEVRADAGYRSEAEKEKLANEHSSNGMVIDLGREGKLAASKIDRQRYPRTASMAAKLQTEEGKAAYRKRKWIAEPPNGWIKSVLGFRQFSMRGLARCDAELKLVCMALNLRRMCAMEAS